MTASEVQLHDYWGIEKKCQAMIQTYDSETNKDTDSFIGTDIDEEKEIDIGVGI